MIYMCMVVECGHGFMLPYHIHFSIKTSLYQPHLFRAWLCQTYLDPTNLCQALALSNLTLQSITVTNVKIPFLKFSLPTFSLSIRSMSIKFVFPIYCLSNFSFFDVLAINRICLKLKSIRPAGVAGVAMPFPFFTSFGSLHGATQEGSTWGIMESWSPSNLTVLHFPKLQGQGSDLACISSTYPAFHAFL